MFDGSLAIMCIASAEPRTVWFTPLRSIKRGFVLGHCRPVPSSNGQKRDGTTTVSTPIGLSLPAMIRSGVCLLSVAHVPASGGSRLMHAPPFSPHLHSAQYGSNTPPTEQQHPKQVCNSQSE